MGDAGRVVEEEGRGGGAGALGLREGSGMLEPGSPGEISPLLSISVSLSVKRPGGAKRGEGRGCELAANEWPGMCFMWPAPCKARISC